VSAPAATGSASPVVHDRAEPATARTTRPDQAAPFEPVIIGFTCNWCSYRAADLAGTARIRYAPNVRLIRLMCSGRLDPTFVLQAFASGADGVVVTGCWPADCHYRVQNVKALRRFQLLRRVLAQLGIEPQRFQRVYASAAEGRQLAGAFDRLVEDVRPLGPLGWGRQPDAGAEAEPDGVPPMDRRPPERQAAREDGS
jgi:F420-non-reducing hydrogenase iron-sulfur subunit